MSSSLELLTQLTSLGASVSLDGDDLVLNAPKDTITPELRTALRLRKLELVELLRSVRPQQPIALDSASDKSSMLSHAQQRVWFLSQLEPGNTIWNVATILHIRGRLNEAALSRSLSEVVSRQSVLRSVFNSADGVPHCAVLPQADGVLKTIAFTDAMKARAEAHAEAVKPFDLAAEPAFRTLLCTAPSNESFLVLAAHHIICDGWSLGILASELSSLYQAFSRGAPSPLPALSCQYSDYVAWEGKTTRDALNADLVWWKERLAAPLPVMQLPTDRPRVSRNGTAGSRITTHLSQSVVDRLSRFTHQQEVTPFMFLLAAFKILLFRYTGLEDMLVGTVSSHRKRREFKPVIGMFANPVVLRTSLSGNPSFRDLLARVKSTVTSSFTHDTVPFDRLVEYLHPDRDAIQSPLFQVSFTYQNLPIAKLDWPGVEITPEPVHTPGARYDISVEVWENNPGLSCDFEFRTDLFDAATIERLQRNYLQLIDSILADCDTPIEHLCILTAAEQQQLTATWNGSTEDYPDRPIHILFEECCQERPDAVALVEGERSTTYRQLDLAANCIAYDLLSHGLATGDPVAILISRSTNSVTAMLGILKAGGFYVPLESKDPELRLLHSLTGALVKYILVDSVSAPEWLLKRTEFVCLDVASMTKPSDTRNLVNPPTGGSLGVSVDDVMCVLYTSGTTGIPKGIEIVHRGVARLLFSKECASFGRHDAVLHMAPEAFDASLLEIWAPLLHGGTCVIDAGLHPSIREIALLLQTHRVTAAWLTASLFNWIVAEAPRTFAPLREIYIGGEVLSIRHVRLAQQALPHLKIINGYGPTEATVFTCVYPIPQSIPSDLDSIPIGRPISNTEVYVLDAHQQPVPIGVLGELYIGGAALARGYRNQPDLTRDRFIPNPLTGRGRLYRSGDLATWLPDGNLRFVGRSDDQFKIRGHRIELSEIETAIAKHPGIVSNAVVVERSNDAETRLIAWFSPDDVPSDELRTALIDRLPPYMVPSLLLPLHSMPLLQNGKIDRAALATLPHATQPHEASVDTEEQGDLVWLIAQAMAELLGVATVGLHDDFFALGGHSLLALQLAARIERLVNLQVSAALLFRASTPKTIALLLEEGHLCRPHSLVPLRPQGTLPPLFCVHLLADGTIQQYLSMFRALDTKIPVFALCPVDFAPGPDQAISLQEMAAAHILNMKQVKGRGNYYLCGYSSGGILAFEIAQQLHRQGDKVTLILIDSFPPRVLRRMLSQDPGKVVGLLSHSSAWKRIGKRLGHRASELKDQAQRLIRQEFSTPEPVAAKTPEEILAAQLSSAMRRYTPYPYHGQAILLQSRDDDEVKNFNLDGLNNWGKFIAGKIEVRSIPGNHLQIMKPPFVDVLAEELLRVLSTPVV